MSRSCVVQLVLLLTIITGLPDTNSTIEEFLRVSDINSTSLIDDSTTERSTTEGIISQESTNEAEVCNLVPELGECQSRYRMWYYDILSEECDRFFYSGCGGNNNRFASQDECEGQCKRPNTPSTNNTSSTSSSNDVTTITPTSTAVVDPLPEVCQASLVLEQCAGAGEVWYLTPTRSECVSHVNSDTGAMCRTTGVFDSWEACHRSCGLYINPCKQYPVAGKCPSRYIMWYYDETRQQCDQFIYSGCGGNNNRFKTREECEVECRYPNDVEIKTTTISPVTPPTEYEKYGISESLVPCGTNFTVYYYDSKNEIWIEINIGRCQRANSYRSEEECERQCGALRDINVCEARLDPGPCQESITKFYWDPASGTCQSYAYGGCHGGPNRFSSIDECEEVCGSSGPGNNMTELEVSINPVTNEYYEGDRVELKCTTKGNPTPTIIWQRALKRPLPISVELFDGVLIIENAVQEDSGEYRCIATNPLASVDSTAVVAIRARPTRQKLTVQPMAPSVAEGQSTRLICTGTLGIPADSIEWNRQDGRELLPNVRSENGVLYIEHARMENQGIYVCQSSSIGVAQVPILVTVVAVGTPPPSGHPNITLSVDRLTIPTGSSGTVDCTPRGYPLPLIKWKKHSGVFSPRTSQKGHTLVISNAQDDDEGYYFCEGSTSSGTAIGSNYIYVEIEKREPPRVEIWPQGEQAVSLGTEYELHCRVLGGIPDPDVMWARAGARPFSSTTHIQPHNIIRFETIGINDEGEYTCSATNIAGTASASSVLKVKSGNPNITVSADHLTILTGSSGTVDCTPQGYPLPLIKWSKYSGVFSTGTSQRGHTLVISNAQDDDEGCYLCEGSTSSGEAIASTYIFVEIENECKLLPQLGVCRSRYVMWFFDVNTHNCLQFIYSGCGGNNNRFETSNDCMSYCGTNAVVVTTAATTIIISTTNSSIPITSTTSSSNPITSTPITTTTSSDTTITSTLSSSTPITTTTSSDTTITSTLSSSTPITTTTSSDTPITSTLSSSIPITTPPITSTTSSSTSITTTPITTIVNELPEGCQASPALEQCEGAGEVWYLDPTRSECVSHINSVTGATCRTTGVFYSQEACERSCGIFRDIDVCRYAMEPGQCRNFVPKYYFDARTQSCKVFRYGGCFGGPNRFSTLDECMQVCRPYIEPCKQYPEAGNCNSRNIMWYYDQSRDQCGQFIYSGCGGNNNRFESENECEGQCKRQHIPRITTTSSTTTSSSTTSSTTTSSSTTSSTTTSSSTTTPSTTITLTSSATIDELPEGCQTSPALEQCAGAGEVWYLDPTRNVCVLHINSDTGATCRTTGVFDSQEACERTCGVSIDVDPCKQYRDKGNCLSSYYMWYYDETRQQCDQFIYTGCGGNNNRFKSREDCEGQCRYPNNVEIKTTTSAALSVVTPPAEYVNEECRIPEALVPCGANVTVFYYDSNNKKCVESNIGGCRHANSYRTEEECERRCGAFRDINVCEARLDPGPCRESITKFYWDPASGKCQSYAYGGCLGGSNRFSSIDECEEVCGSSGPDSNEVVPPNCDCYNEECSRLQCENGLVQTATADGCRRCSCKEVVDICESARQECVALRCSYGDERFTDANGCVGCRCLENPCATLSCSAEEQCVVKVSRDPNTQESKYSAVCEMESNEIVPDCESFNEECAQLRCSYAVQRTPTAHGCERCSCVPLEVDCAPHRQDCETLRCAYGTEKYNDADGCGRCKCKKPPCDGVNCLPEERCVPNAYRDPVTQETKFNTACIAGLTIPANCTDNKHFADCRLIVRSKFCKHKYFSKFCCYSCMKAGQLTSQDLEALSD